MPTKNQLQRWLDECRAKNADLTSRVDALMVQLAKLQEGEEPPPPTTPPPSTGGTVVRSDDFTSRAKTTELWGVLDSARPELIEFVSTGGPDGGPFVRCHGQEPNQWGHVRSQIGRNGRNKWLEDKSLGGESTFWVYDEGVESITAFSMRFPSNFPQTAWQQVMQMKQAQSYSSSPPDPNAVYGVANELQVYGNKMHLSSMYGNSSVGGFEWDCPVPTLGQWFECSMRYRHSQDKAKGYAEVKFGQYSSGRITGRTLCTDQSGKPIQSALMMGYYGDTGLPNTYVDIAKVRIIKP